MQTSKEAQLRPDCLLVINQQGLLKIKRLSLEALTALPPHTPAPGADKAPPASITSQCGPFLPSAPPPCPSQAISRRHTRIITPRLTHS